MQNENGNMLDPFAPVAEYEQGLITWGELLNKMAGLCWQYPTERDKVLNFLAEHPDESVQRVAQDMQRMRREEERCKDIEYVRRTSPLQPGVRLFLYGGYDAAFSKPWWLNGREYYPATFVDFIPCGADKMPAALVELEEELDLTEASGRRHSGRYALLKLHHVTDWGETETVRVHVVTAPLSDGEAFYASHPSGTEIESHASYRVKNEEESTSATPAKGH